MHGMDELTKLVVHMKVKRPVHALANQLDKEGFWS
jgi:hypothetical protein